MRRETLELLRCPKCGVGGLIPEAEVAGAAMAFGPARCVSCGARFPVHDGLIDFVGDRAKLKALQQAMELPWVARSWERYVRPAVDTVLTRGRLDHESEYTVLRNLIGSPPGPIVDLGCGAGLVLRRLSRDFSQVPVIGVDMSRPMLEEAMAQVRENAEAADFVRAQVPLMPFNDATLGAVVAVGFIHFIDELDELLREVARSLKPGGRFVATTYEAGKMLEPMHRTAGLSPRSEEALRASTAKAGLVEFERVRVSPFLLWKAERATSSPG
ncbi:MAG: methyltransferase domain-containing protein [Archangium sp.]|nr:methyltransferase domain-containing protein [Archangium sp.]MDP3155358.1 methyltransferase domain-containing protein [Archangium sp.]MDP3573690.1 methyltransferase domain-containing protein [Archangium sp.]